MNIETRTEERLHSPGAKPKVDYTLIGYVKEKPVYCVPVEVKKAMVTKDMAQLVQYMCTLGSKGEYIASKMCIGFLLDEHHFRVAFAPFFLSDGLLLPVVLFSPVLKWREDTSTVAVFVWRCVCYIKLVTVTPNDLEGAEGWHHPGS